MTCQPATFGAQEQDVLNESYRKAWKMDMDNFSTRFNPNILPSLDILEGANPEGST